MLTYIIDIIPNNKGVIANASELVEHLRELKKTGISHWWQNVLTFGFDYVRNSTFNTKWCNKSYTDRTGFNRPLNIRIVGENHIGQILPNTDDITKLNEKKKNPKIIYTKRTKKSKIQIQQWSQKCILQMMMFLY